MILTEFDTAMRALVRRGKLAMPGLILPALFACGKASNAPPQPPPPEVTVIKTAASPITVFEDYAAQTEAVESVEIRARVGGILQRQSFKDGAPVKKGDFLFLIDQQSYLSALAQAKANLAQAQASHLNSRQNLARLRPLLADQAISQQDLDAAVAKERTDAAAVDAARAQVEQAQLNLGYTAIRAPRDGVISKALIKPGGLVNASTTLLATLYSVDPIYANFSVSEKDLGSLQKQYKARPANHAAGSFKLKLIDGSDYKYGGKLDFIDVAVDPRNGTIPVRVVVPNPEGALKPGQFVRVIAPTREDPDAILIPQQAVQELQGKRFVFVVGQDNKAISRNIDAATRVGNNWAVEQGLEPGELVVVEGIAKLRPGVPVKPVLPQQQLAASGNAAQDTTHAGQPAPVRP